MAKKMHSEWYYAQSFNVESFYFLTVSCCNTNQKLKFAYAWKKSFTSEVAAAAVSAVAAEVMNALMNFIS